MATTFDESVTVNASVDVDGILTVDGFGVHNFAAGGTGQQAIAVTNSSAGTGNTAVPRAVNDAIGR